MARKKSSTIDQPTPVPTPPPVEEKVETVTVQDDREILYPTLEITERSIVSEKGPLYARDWKTILGWETEKEYQERMVQEDPTSKPEHWLYGEEYHCLNRKGEKIRCWNNSGNRPLDRHWCDHLVHMILHGQWAGPHTYPGETVNGETVRISKYGDVLSAQHQGTACIFADEDLQQSRTEERNAIWPKYPFWNGQEEVFIETIVVAGVSCDERVLRTIDYVKPRSMADMLYTMQVFRVNEMGGKRNQDERREMTKMLAVAIDTLWERTDAKGYKTHPEICGFLERHKKLLDAVAHIFVENNVRGPDGGRKISKARLNPGQCAALCYLMGASGTDEGDSDEYRNMMPPDESKINWSYWNKGRDFWSKFAYDRSFLPVRHALGYLMESSINDEDNQGLGGRNDEKLAILANAWERFRDHPEEAGAPFDEEDLGPGGILYLTYSDLDDKGNKLPDGRIKLVNKADFYGIDVPPAGLARSKANKTAPPEITVSPEELEKAKKEADKRRGVLSPEELKQKNEEDEAAARRAEQQRKLAENRMQRKK